MPCEDTAGDAPTLVRVFVGVAAGDTPTFAALRAELLVSARRWPDELPSLPLNTSLMELLTLDAAALSFAINPRLWRTGIAGVFSSGRCPPLDPSALARSAPDDILLVVVVKVNGVAESEVCPSRPADPPAVAMVGYG